MNIIIVPILAARQLLFILYGGVVVFLFGTVTPLLYFIRAPRALRIRMPAFWSILWRIGMFTLLWIRLDIRGRRNIPKKPCIYICKHQSQFETLYFNHVLPRSCYVFKKELLRTPFLGWGLKYTGSIPIDRSKGMKAFKDVVKMGKERLARGISVMIFPEGTRVPPGEHPPFQKSGLMLAKNSDSDIVLVAHNSASRRPPGHLLIKPGTITVIISEPYPTDDMTLDQLSRFSHDWMKKQMLRIQG